MNNLPLETIDFQNLADPPFLAIHHPRSFQLSGQIANPSANPTSKEHPSHVSDFPPHKIPTQK
jgi:hypothetical protein